MLNSGMRRALTMVITIGSLAFASISYGYTTTTVSCSCSQLFTCPTHTTPTLITPHTKYINIDNVAYSPSSSGDEHSNVLDHTEVKIVTQNSSTCTITGTEHPSAKIFETRTVTVTGTVSHEGQTAVEASFQVVKVSAAYTLGFSASVAGEVQQGSEVSASVDAPYTIPPGQQTNWAAKFYKKTNSVSVTQKVRISHTATCQQAGCGLTVGVVGTWQDESGSASGFRYTSIALEYRGLSVIQ